MTAAFDTTASGFTITYVTTTSSHTTITGNVPSNVVNGDLMIAVVGNNNGTVNPYSFTPPNGWTSAYTPTYLNATYCVPMGAWYRVASSEPVSYDWTFDTATYDSFIVIHRVTGADTSNVLAGTSVPGDGYSAGPSCPSMTTTSDNALAVFIFAAKQASITSTDANYPPDTTGMYARITRASSSGLTHGLAYKTITPAGATGIQTWTNVLTSSKYYSSASFAIKSAPTLDPIRLKRNWL